LLATDYDLFSKFYNVNNYGLWEHNKYVLIRKDSKENFANSNNISTKELSRKIKGWKELLYREREKRERPRLDDKVLTSWNALMLKAYIDAYRVFKESRFLNVAIKNAKFIANYSIKRGWRFKS